MPFIKTQGSSLLLCSTLDVISDTMIGSGHIFFSKIVEQTDFFLHTSSKIEGFYAAVLRTVQKRQIYNFSFFLKQYQRRLKYIISIKINKFSFIIFLYPTAFLSIQPLFSFLFFIFFKNLLFYFFLLSFRINFWLTFEWFITARSKSPYFLTLFMILFKRTIFLINHFIRKIKIHSKL